MLLVIRAGLVEPWRYSWTSRTVLEKPEFIDPEGPDGTQVARTPNIIIPNPVLITYLPTALL